MQEPTHENDVTPTPEDTPVIPTAENIAEPSGPETPSSAPVQREQSVAAQPAAAAQAGAESTAQPGVASAGPVPTGTPGGPEISGEPAHVAEPWRKRIRPLHLGIAGGAVVVLAVTGGLIFSALKPTAIESAAEACSGTLPLERLFDEIAASEKPSDAADLDDIEEELLTNPEDEEEESATAAVFEGVVAVEDDGGTLIINTKSQDEDILGLGNLAMECVYEELDVPTHVSERIAQTRSLDGRQEGTWDNFSASWSYHPNSGANLIIVAE